MVTFPPFRILKHLSPLVCFVSGFAVQAALPAGYTAELAAVRSLGDLTASPVMRDGQPWCVQTGAKLESGTVRVEFAATKPLDRALLISTTDTGFPGKRQWTDSSATVEKRDKVWLITAPLPAGTTAWFVNSRSGELTASSDYQEGK